MGSTLSCVSLDAHSTCRGTIISSKSKSSKQSAQEAQCDIFNRLQKHCNSHTTDLIKFGGNSCF
jgi:hypothetical protein